MDKQLSGRRDDGQANSDQSPKCVHVYTQTHMQAERIRRVTDGWVGCDSPGFVCMLGTCSMWRNPGQGDRRGEIQWGRKSTDKQNDRQMENLTIWKSNI